MPATASAAAVIAKARVHGRDRVIAHGSIHGHELTLRRVQLKRGHYTITLLKRAHHRWVVIGHSTLTIS